MVIRLGEVGDVDELSNDYAYDVSLLKVGEVIPVGLGVSRTVQP